MTDYLKNTLLSTSSDTCNSLEGITGYVDREKALVQEQNRWFRFYAASTATPDGVGIIAPANITPPAPGRWIREGIPGPVGPRADKPVNLASCPEGALSEGCLRSTAVLSVGNTVATFTMDLAALLTSIGVPETGHVLVSSRVALIAMHETNGNLPTPLTQIYPVILDVVDGSINNVTWNATFETAQVPPGYLAVPGTVAGDNALITAITPTGTSIDLVWTASPDFFNSDFLPGAEFCVQAITGVGV